MISECCKTNIATATYSNGIRPKIEFTCVSINNIFIICIRIDRIGVFFCFALRKIRLLEIPACF